DLLGIKAFAAAILAQVDLGQIRSHDTETKALPAPGRLEESKKIPRRANLKECLVLK
ncbi:hypothetical protein PSYMO_34599, partial [Pseudomonas amygdali pv. mori str. 301020]